MDGHAGGAACDKVPPAVGAGTGSTSGWTMFMRPLNEDGLPKNMYSVPGFSLPYIHLMPLKKTISISPEPSPTNTLILFIMLNFTGSAGVPAVSGLTGAADADAAPYRSVLMTLALICT